MTYAFLNVRLHVLPSLKLNIAGCTCLPLVHSVPPPLHCHAPVEGSSRTEEAQQIYVNMLCVAPSGV